MSGRRKPDLQVTLTGRQGMFVKATADEVLFLYSAAILNTGGILK